MEKENKLRLIDANALIKTMREEDKKCPGVPWSTTAIPNCIERLDPVDAVEVVHGRWKRVEVELDRGVTTHRFACSECGFLKNTLTGNYCPNCGAKMDGGDGDG